MLKAQRLSISRLATGYRSGRLKPEDVITGIYERIAKEGERPVWISLAPRENNFKRDRPLTGIPFAVKDNIDVAGMETTAGCPGFAYLADKTAPVVQRLLDAGAVLIGKTNMDQFATGLVGTRSPFGACSSVYNPDYISGGSSSGSAVAVASGLVSFALGTDTAGSGRVPAAFNNITGLKPTRGLLSARGVVPACRSLDCVSIFAGDSADAALIFDVTQGFDEHDPFSRPSREQFAFSGTTRVGVPRAGQLTADRSLFDAVVNRLPQFGAVPVEIDIEPFLEAAKLLYSGPWVAERYAAVGDFLERGGSGIDPIVREIILGARNLSTVDAFRAFYRLAEFRRMIDPVWDDIDALLLPTTPAIFTHAEVDEKPIERNSLLGTYTNFVNLLDLTAVASPAGFRENGLPFGVSWIGPAFSDHALIDLAGKHERALNQEQEPRIQIAVVGAHLTGEPLNWQLIEREAVFVRNARTSPEYRFYALAGSKPEKPGLIHQPGFDGPGTELEIWEMPEHHAGSFLKLIAPPLALGTLKLDDGTSVQGFVCEAYGANGAREITSFGGWRAYRKSLG